MAELVIRGCGILTMNPAREQLANGDIHIQDGRLSHVGAPLAAVPAGAEVIDGSGKVAIPGFISCHHHLFQCLLRGFAPNTDLLQWLSACILPTTPHFRPEDLYWGARLNLAECLESGVTTTVDWAYNLHSVEHAEATLDGIEESGARVHFAYGPSLLDGSSFDVALEHLETVRARRFGGGRTAGRVMLWAGLGGPNFQPMERVREEMECVRGWGLPIHIHLGENRAQGPRDAVECLDRIDALGPDLLLAHAIHFVDGDLPMLARSGTKVSYNVLSNMRVASGICPVVDMRELGIDIGLGIDGAAANDNNDYFALMRASIGVQRLRWLRGDCVTVDDIMEMATLGGAKCLGQEREIGSLEVGKRADVVLIDPHSLNFKPLNNFLTQLIFCGQPRNVDTVIVDGRVVKRNGAMVGIDVDDLLAHCDRSTRYLIDKGGCPRDPICRGLER
ncbi:MAG: amidohydrolase family protein [Candidatus Binatia bacterium]